MTAYAGVILPGGWAIEPDDDLDADPGWWILAPSGESVDGPLASMDDAINAWTARESK